MDKSRGAGTNHRNEATGKGSPRTGICKGGPSLSVRPFYLSAKYHRDTAGKNQQPDEKQHDSRNRIRIFHDLFSSEPLTETAHIKTFHALRHQAVAQQRCQQPREVVPRQRHQTHGVAQR